MASAVPRARPRPREDDTDSPSITRFHGHLDDAIEDGHLNPTIKNRCPPTALNHDNEHNPSLPSRRLTEQQTDHIEHLQHLRSHIGLNPHAPVSPSHNTALAQDPRLLSRIRFVLREPLAEFFGTFIMVLFGDGSVAQVLLSKGQTSAPGGDGFGPYQSISWGWGLGVMLGIYVAGDSGGYLNPAITFANCFYRGLPWRRFPVYLLAQFLGGFVGAGVVYANYVSAIDSVEGKGVRTLPPGQTATAGVFCTYPQPFLTKASQFFSEFIASTILLFVIFALKDSSNPGAMGKSGAGNLFPLALFFLIFGLGACFGWETGYAINLARDFGPRLMSYAVGYGHEVWSAGGYYFWIPMVAPFLGCMFGGFLYDLCIYTGPESPLNSHNFGVDRYTKSFKTGRRGRIERTGGMGEGSKEMVNGDRAKVNDEDV